jgi:hypothetical protein
LEEIMAFSTSKMNLKGCLFGPPSPKDYRTSFKDIQIPDKVDLRQYCTAVEDQGQLGSCTANATVGAMEFLYKKRDGQSADLSRLFTYYNSRRIRGTTNQDTGAYISDATASILAFGVCREDIWPYNINTFANEPSQQAYQEAMMHEAIQYARVDGAEGSVYALAAGFPVVFGTRIPERCYQEAQSTGVFPIPSDEEIMNNQGGGHCMLIVGYDKPKKIFIVRNSWGQGWGDRGYCYIPFEVMGKCSPPEGFWIIGELAKPGNFSVARPGISGSIASPATATGVSKSSGLAEKASKMREEIRASLDKEIDSSSRRIEKILSGTTGEKKSSPGGPFGGYETCPSCNGSGEVDGQKCRQCGGRGEIEVFDRPRPGQAANATLRGGQRFRETAACPICQGNGACPSCSGKGGTCQRCGGTGKCPVCGGTGTVGN